MAKFVLALVLALAPAAAALKANSTAPITETVKIDGVDVYSQSAGHASMGVCTSLSQETVNDPNRPSITVCGTATKVTVFLRNRCEAYHEYSHEIGTCNTGAAPESCVTASPAQMSWMQTAQSFRIESC